jgi:hypothetical protein
VEGEKLWGADTALHNRAFISARLHRRPVQVPGASAQAGYEATSTIAGLRHARLRMERALIVRVENTKIDLMRAKSALRCGASPQKMVLN